MNAAQVKEARAAVHRLPRCYQCRAHIGTAATICGACKHPQPLTSLELMRMGKLVRKHWGSGVLRELVMHPSYRPTLTVTVFHSQRERMNIEDRAELAKQLSERDELANLYDRSQAQRGLARRAVRI